MVSRPLASYAPSEAVGVQVRAEGGLTERERRLIDAAGLWARAPIEAWSVMGSNKQLAYLTHGVFRFFGKFPPPIARRLIDEFTAPGEWVVDPMCGSGTTAVEALALARHVVARDVSPLSGLLCGVKTTHVPEAQALEALARVQQRFGRSPRGALPGPVGLRNADHWFLPQTVTSLGRIRVAIDPEAEGPVRNLLLAAFASTVRRVSRATTQQGRLFLDAAKASTDAWPTFAARLRTYAAAVQALPRRWSTRARFELLDARARPARPRSFGLAIVHPPYFNNYRYSSINSLELAWLGMAPREVHKGEIREAFKLGHAAKVGDYVEDLAAAVSSLAAQVKGTLALMMGDTIIRGDYVPVTRRLLDQLQTERVPLRLQRLVLRVPRYTEASWVASQRRTGDQLGVALNDFILIFGRTA